jgi:hypothetical protein
MRPVPFDLDLLLMVVIFNATLAMLFWLAWLIVSLWRRGRDR